MNRRALLPFLAIVALVWLAACRAPRDETGGDDVPRGAIRTAIAESLKARGDSLTLTDPRSGKSSVRLVFDHVHEGVELTPGGRYVACVDFKGGDGTVYDVDYYVDGRADGLHIVDVVMHKAGETDVVADSTRARLESVR